LLARCGAEFCLTPDNAVQHAVQLAEVGCPIPWLTMTELVAQAVAGDQRKMVGLIGTKLVMHSSTYQTPLGMRGVRVLPPEGEEAEGLDKIIYGELIFGHIRPESRQFMFQVLQKLKERGCEGVILGCSEAPLVVTAENSPLPIYDPGDILAEAGVRRAMAMAEATAV
jgi:aspartate racemase